MKPLICNIDIDECAENIDFCAQTCTNEVGNYSCSCESGFRLADDEQSCYDIDECVEDINGCHHICTNDVGSYICSCIHGYYLTSDGQSCHGEHASVYIITHVIVHS